jgi:serpin B
MIRKALYIALVATVASCGTTKNKVETTTHAKDIPNSTTEIAAVESKTATENSFWGKLLGEACREMDKENICLSPLSAQFAMAMLANGAEGETKEEICKALGSYTDTNAHYNKLLESTLENKDYEIDIANSIWINDKLRSINHL